MARLSWIYNGVEFKPGDRVRIVGFEVTLAPDGMGDGIEWQNSWIDVEMDELIGREGVIAYIEQEGVTFEEIEGEKPIDFMYPLSVLQKVTLH